MKKFQTAVIAVFFAILLVPLLTFNFQPESISEIDNRELSENPFSPEVCASLGVRKGIENYLQDRIGLRTQMIETYQVLNDRLFGVMEHPTYTYGRDGYVFFKFTPNMTYGAYEETFADFVVKLKDYCAAREIPFRFVMNPKKESVMTDELPVGYRYNDDWVFELMQSMTERGVVCVDNITYLQQLYRQGEPVFNRQYNAGHWNDLGAFYGAGHIIDSLKSDYPSLQNNTMEDFSVSSRLQTSLLVSRFPISETEDVFVPKTPAQELTSDYTDEVARNPSYPGFGYYVNDTKAAEGTPRVLIFQGSYMNGSGYKFMANAFGEYIFVHDYQNVLNAEYYVNLFQPDCVIFETAEYTVSETYYSQSGMADAVFQPAVSQLKDPQRVSVSQADLPAEAGTHFASVQCPQVPQGTAFAYLQVDGNTYDLENSNGVYGAVIPLDSYRNGVSFTVIYGDA